MLNSRGLIPSAACYLSLPRRVAYDLLRTCPGTGRPWLCDDAREDLFAAFFQASTS